MKAPNLPHLLPSALWCLVQASLARGQSGHQLSVNSLSFFPASSLSTTANFTLPHANQLSVSVAVCSGAPTNVSASFFVTNNTASGIPGPGGGTDVYSIPISNGYGSWSGLAPDGGFLAADNLDGVSLEIGVSTDGVVHELQDALPLLGDTTSNEAIIFSPPFLPPPIDHPKYPNYTLPPAALSLPMPPSSYPNFTLILSSTSSSLTSLPQTACSLLSSSSSGTVISENLWLRDEEGWRLEWLVGGLSPQTNYTAYVIQDQTKLSGPIYFVTKSAAFPCPLVHSLPYCPSVSYAASLPVPPAPALTYDYTNMPEAFTSPLLQYMANFTIMLLTFPCGRDVYSPLQSCQACQSAYLKWLCNVQLPRCSEASPNSTSSSSNSAQQPYSALAPQPTGPPSRNTNLPNMTVAYSVLLPCLETCNAVDRACPIFLGFKCPVSLYNAAASYGVGYIDGGQGGVMNGGSTGVAQDRWGNVWCNGS